MTKTIPPSQILPQHPIVALATPFAKSAIALIRVSGKNCLSLLCKVLQKSGSKTLLEENKVIPQHVSLCTIVDIESFQKIDSCVFTFFRGPHSYTGEDCAELSIHGSTVGIEKVLSLLRKIGFEDAQPGEFTRRAFINGKLDLTQTEAIHSIVEAQSNEAHSLAVAQLSGALTKKIDSIKDTLLSLVAICTVSLDYPDDEIQESTHVEKEKIQVLIDQVDFLMQSYTLGKIQKEGVKVVLAGCTNAGKSSLFNCLLKQNRALVSETHGTTRDYIEHHTTLKGIPLRLFDTAGLRTTKNTIEKQGIDISTKLVHSSDVLLFVVDSTLGWTQQDEKIFLDVQTSPVSTILVWNKSDSAVSKDFQTHIPQHILDKIKVIPVSATEYTNIHSLQTALYELITEGIQLPKEQDVIINSQRQYECLCECKDALEHVHEGLVNEIPLDMISLDLDLSLKALGKITGEIGTEDILDRVFSNFCVGK